MWFNETEDILARALDDTGYEEKWKRGEARRIVNDALWQWGATSDEFIEDIVVFIADKDWEQAYCDETSMWADFFIQQLEENPELKREDLNLTGDEELAECLDNGGFWHMLDALRKGVPVEDILAG